MSSLCAVLKITHERDFVPAYNGGNLRKSDGRGNFAAGVKMTKKTFPQISPRERQTTYYYEKKGLVLAAATRNRECDCSNAREQAKCTRFGN